MQCVSSGRFEGKVLQRVLLASSGASSTTSATSATSSAPPSSATSSMLVERDSRFPLAITTGRVSSRRRGRSHGRGSDSRDAGHEVRRDVFEVRLDPRRVQRPVVFEEREVVRILFKMSLAKRD